MASLKHTHQYVRYKSRSKGAKSIYDIWFKCADPACTHFAKYEMVVDKKSKCPACGNEFVLDREASKRAIPKCLDCRDTKQAKVYRTAKTLLDNLMPKDDKKEIPGLEDLFD